MAQQQQQQQHQGGGGYKVEPGVTATTADHDHHPHHAQQGPPPPQHLQHPRPSSIVHQQQQQHHQTAPTHPNSAYPTLPQYAQAAAGAAGQQHSQEIPYYTQPSPYSTSGATGTYSSAETPDIMAAAQMTARPYPPISYHTPQQSNSPASVASPSGHDQHGRPMYGQPASQLQQQPMYYPSPQQYPPMPAHGGPSPYAQHPQQHHQTMTSQPNLLMSHPTGQHPMQHPGQQHQPGGMTSSPRTKIEHLPQQQQLQRPPTGPLGPPQHQQNGPPMNANNIPNGAVNPNAAPGPIPATTPLVVRQDGNGVQWIAFEYSRDRVKMEYTIRCDVESVNVETLSPEFKTENCVYPRACCAKDQYRGNRLVYETECNTVGWALAELNPCLRGKRGLIQRAVDSWRNSNQDPRLRSRRVRRMAKINTRKQVQAATHNPHMPGPGGPTGMPAAGGMGPGVNTSSMVKPSMSSMGGSQLHHHHAHPDGSTPGGPDDGSVDGSYVDDQHHPPGVPTSSAHDVRQSHTFSNYPASSYPSHPPVGVASIAPALHPSMRISNHGIAATSSTKSRPVSVPGEDSDSDSDDPASFRGTIPEARKRKFILVDDATRNTRVRVRVTLDSVDTAQIPDSYRRAHSVYPRSWFPVQMQLPIAPRRSKPRKREMRFFGDDLDDVEVMKEDGDSEDENEHENNTKILVKVPLGAEGIEGNVACPRMTRSLRKKEVRLNDLGYRMAWQQSRIFSKRTVFLQRALDTYRNKIRSNMESAGQNFRVSAPHFETRAGKRRWAERMKGGGGR